MSNRRRTKPRHPIILVPGLGGSQLWMKKSRPPLYAQAQEWGLQSQMKAMTVTVDPLDVWSTLFGGKSESNNSKSMWINLVTMLSSTTSWVEDMRLLYDKESHTTKNSSRHIIEALNFGCPKSVEVLDPRMQKLFWPTMRVVAETTRDVMNPFCSDSSQGALGGLLLSPVTVPVAAFASVKECVRVQLTKIPLSHGTFPVNELFGDVSQAARWLPNEAMPLSLGLRAPKLVMQALDSLSYYYEMTKELYSRGYTRGENLRAAPYDFRKAPNELGEFYDNLKDLIEETYTKNGNSPVVMVAHSMGNPVMLYFYNHVVSRQWKNKFVRLHVALAAPWAGAVKPIKLICSGDALGIRFLDRLKMRMLQRSLPSLTFLMPSLATWPNTEVLVKTPDRDYTVQDFKQLFNDLGHREGYSMWKDTHKLTKDLMCPDVEMHCVYGVGIRTPGCLVYQRGEFPDKDPQVVVDDGDGTVNRRSLEAFKHWIKQSSKPVTSWTLHEVEHTDIIKDQRVIDYVWDLANRS